MLTNTLCKHLEKYIIQQKYEYLLSCRMTGSYDRIVSSWPSAWQEKTELSTWNMNDLFITFNTIQPIWFNLYPSISLCTWMNQDYIL